MLAASLATITIPPLLAAAQPNGVTTTYAYNATDFVTSVVHRNASGTTLASFTYVVNPLGNRESVTYADGSRVEYLYDSNSRITAERHFTSDGSFAGSILYTYDAVGNLIAQSGLLGAATFTYNAITFDVEDAKIGNDEAYGRVSLTLPYATAITNPENIRLFVEDMAKGCDRRLLKLMRQVPPPSRCPKLFFWFPSSAWEPIIGSSPLPRKFPKFSPAFPPRLQSTYWGPHIPTHQAEASATDLPKLHLNSKPES